MADSLCADIAALKREGKSVFFVSSGAIALGRRALGLRAARFVSRRARPPRPPAKCVWQRLMPIFWQARDRGAQILFILDDTEDRRRYLNARATLKTLLDWAPCR